MMLSATEGEERRSIAVVVATPPGFNPGMVATELALSAFLKRHGWLSQARVYRLMSLSERLKHLPEPQRLVVERRSDTGITYGSAVSDFDRVVDGDVLVFWADFLHMAQYLRTLERLIEAGGINVPVEIIRRLLLLTEADDALLSRTISFGTTLLFNTLRDDDETDYGAALRRFLGSARRVWVRDALSAARVAHLRGEYRTGYFGVDAALLLRREDIVGPQVRHSDGAGATLVFLGRDVISYEPMMNLATRLSNAMDRPLRWLPWGDTLAFPALRPSALECCIDDTANTIGLLKAVAGASLVVTDTYHLAVMAWNLGVPAVGSFGGHTETPSDVSAGAEFNWRDKREIFFSQYDALDFLVRPEELRDPRLLDRRINHVFDCVRNEALCKAISSRIHTHATAVEADLGAAISALLRDPRPHASVQA